MAQAHYEIVLREIWETPTRARTQRQLFDPTLEGLKPQLANDLSRLEEQARSGILLFVDTAYQQYLHKSYLRVRHNHHMVLRQLEYYFRIRDLRCIGSKPTLQKLFRIIKLY